MFGTQNLNVLLLPKAQENLFCGFGYYSCYYGGWPSYCPYTCGYTCHGHITLHCFLYDTHPPIEQQACGLFGSAAPIPGGPSGDPVEALQALRRQLEVALAGIRAHEEELRRQRAAAGWEAAPSRARPGARGQRSE